MRDTLAHRGPDSARTQLFDREGNPCGSTEPAYLGLAHRRLSIIDLSEAGAQPMSNESGSCWITYNGEFYNFADFRDELESKGHVFRSHCDTETILHHYEEYGIEETLRRMNGMFAFGLWDRSNRCLILARDRFGKKPIYFAEVEGGLIFASEMKALYASGLIDSNKLDQQALMESIRFGTPFGERTIFCQIRMLLPGHYAIWHEGRFSLHQYYRHPFETTEPEPGRAIDSWADELEALLTDAIRVRLVADVPVGIFMSGGIDSSLVAALVTKKLNQPIQAYCVAFDESEYDESKEAQRIADYLGIQLTIWHSNLADEKTVEFIARHIDQPLADASLIPTYLVSKAARSHNLKVALTGDGGDEVFAGYDLYRTGLKLWGRAGERERIKQSRTFLEHVWEWRTRFRGVSSGYLALQQQFGARQLFKLCSSTAWAMQWGKAAERDRVRHLAALPARSVLDILQYSDMRTMMVDDVLRKVDLMSMANGLECRCPYLDYRLVEFAARLTLEEKIDRNGRAKYLLRYLLARYVPTGLFERPKKGFCMPWGKECSDDALNKLIQRWRAANFPHLNPEAGDWIFREKRTGALFRKWNAYTHLIFFENYRSWCRDQQAA